MPHFSSLSISRTAFFLCDLQQRFRPLIHQFESILHVSHKMVEASRILNIPLIATEHVPKTFGSMVPELNLSHAQLNLPKTKFSMCIPQVMDFVNEKKIDQVVLFGIESHICVQQTALELLENHLQVYVLADAVSSIKSFEVPNALNRLAQAGATITTSESVLFHLLKDATHPKFKEISLLIKEFQTKSQL